MLYSNIFGKSTKTYPRDEVSNNAKLLLKAGFVDKLMSGSYTLLTLGRLVEKKIENIIREEMNATGAQEILMPLLHPKNIWKETGRWDSAKAVMYQFEKDGKEYALAFTHEEIVVDLIRKHASSYRDLPIKIYHFSTKFRDEPRAKSGILRGREFLMKDLYSAHLSQEDMLKYYQEVSDAYQKIFKKIGLETKIVETGGGVFTEAVTHEFQVLSDGGEDTIYWCSKCDFAQNKEIFKGKEEDVCPKCKKAKVKSSKAIEVGNIFPLGTRYAEKMKVFLADTEGNKKPLWLASYGIGVSRCIGAIVEVYHDEKGIIWPESVAPYKVHLIGLNLDDTTIKKTAEETYQKLLQQKVEVLFDDREDISAGEKLADADLIGVPHRLVISKKTADKVEYKKRAEKEITLLSLEQVLNKIL